MVSLRSLTSESDGAGFTARMRTPDPITGTMASFETRLPYAGPKGRLSVSGALDPAGTRSGNHSVGASPPLGWEYRVPTLGPTRHGVSVPPRSRHNISITAEGLWSNTTADSGDDGLLAFATEAAGPLHVRLAGFVGLPAPAQVQSAVTIETSPPGLNLSIDGTNRSTPHASSWSYFEEHQLEAPSTLYVSEDSRWTWASWSDGGDRRHVASPAWSIEERIYSGRDASSLAFASGDYLEFLRVNGRRSSEAVTSSPVSLQWTWDFAAHADVDFAVFFDGECDGAYGSLDALGGLSAATGFRPETFVVRSPDPGCYWVHAASPEGLPAAFDERLVTALAGPTLLSARFTEEVRVRVGTDPQGLAFVVDGESFEASTDFWWSAGSRHAIGVDRTEYAAGGEAHFFLRWSDGGDAVHEVVPEGPGTFTARFESAGARTAVTALAGALLAVLVTLSVAGWILWRRRRRPPPATPTDTA